MPERFSVKMLDLNDARFSYRETGNPNGFPVVLLHGISSGAASWAHCAAALNKHNAVRVLAWDAPGYGDSSRLSRPAPTAADYAERLRLWLDALSVETCVLVGHSLGALMAAAFAQQHPVRVQALLLASPAIGYGDAPNRAQVRAGRLQALQAGIPSIAEKLPDRLLSEHATAAQREQVREVARQLNPEGYTQAVQMLCGENLYRYTDLPACTQVCCGGRDVVTTPEQSRAYAENQALPFHLIAESGHASPIEQPAALAHIILSLQSLQGVPSYA